MIIKNFKPISGQSCEPTMVGNLLEHAGVILSEPMLFGIGEGLSFIFWDSKQMGYPFLGGRCKQDVLTENIARNLQLSLEIKDTSSKGKAWEFVKSNIDRNVPVGLKLDSYYLEYFKIKLHFAAHYVTIYGYDEKYGYLADTAGIVEKSSLQSIALARDSKGPMASRNRAFTITVSNPLPDLKNVIIEAIRHNAEQYLNPPIQNISYKGIQKTSKQIPTWLKRQDFTPQIISQTGSLMEEAGTGGALFRNMYRDFSQECNSLYPELKLREVYEDFAIIASLWTEVSRHIVKAGETIDERQLIEASQLLAEIAGLEEKSMRMLWVIASDRSNSE
jgi:hypothetical protein